MIFDFATLNGLTIDVQNTGFNLNAVTRQANNALDEIGRIVAR